MRAGSSRTLAIVCGAMVVLVVGLVFQNQSLRTRLAQVTDLCQAAARSQRTTTIVGEAFPYETLIRASGERVSMHCASEELGTLLFVSSSGCEFCDLARPGWNSAMRVAEGSPLRVFGLELEASRETAADSGPPYSVLFAEDRGAALFELIDGVPAALILDQGARVRRAIYGAAAAEIELVVEQISLGELDLNATE